MKKRHVEKCGQCRAETIKAEQTSSFASADSQVNMRSQSDNEKKSSDIQSTSVSDKNAKDDSSLFVVVIDHSSTAGLFQASFVVEGMTCDS